MKQINRTNQQSVAQRTPWHSLSVETISAKLNTNIKLGLEASEIIKRRQTYGDNKLTESRPQPRISRFFAQFHNPLIYVLVLAGAVTLLLGSHIDAFVIFGVVVINAVIGYVQEGKAQQAIQAVRKMLPVHARVWRSGDKHEINAIHLVPGDIVHLESGDKVPADIRLFYVKDFRVDESVLTGESVPTQKTLGPTPDQAGIGDRNSMCHTGTIVVSGQGRGIVVEIGEQTEIGRIGHIVASVKTLSTPLTRKLEKFATQITLCILVLASITMLYGHYIAGLPLDTLFLSVVGLAVAAIPEGMPAVVTIVLAIGARTMAQQKAIVRRLPAVETLGSVNVICTDKTGTLTKNEMTVVRVALASKELSVTGVGYKPEGGFFLGGKAIDPDADAELLAALRCALLCNDADVRSTNNDAWELIGDPTEGALSCLALKGGIGPTVLWADYPRIDGIPFESEHQYMATLHRNPDGDHILYLKGSPEAMLPLCSTQANTEPINAGYWNAMVDRFATSGLRVLALAKHDYGATKHHIHRKDIEGGFQLLAIVGIIDPPRPETVSAILECKKAGIRIKMITGDHSLTAAAIGQQLGLNTDRVLTGEALEGLDERELRKLVADCDVFARASPEHKLRLVAALQAEGYLVAMTGDGVNDAPALKLADIGISMGKNGTDAARESSALVLTDDNFATIAKAVKEGRVVFDNIKKSLIHMLPTNGGEAGVILLAIFAGLPMPVSAGQILWVNTVTSVTLALSLAFEPAEKDTMSHKPRKATESILTPSLSLRILYVIILMVLATFTVFQTEFGRTGDLDYARTAAVNMIVICELFYLFNVRHFTQHAFRLETLTGNPLAIVVSAILVVLQLLFTYSVPMQSLFNSVSLTANSWVLILSIGALVFFGVELEKMLLRAMRVHRL